MRYVITGGGTGGHIYPALAIINEIKRKDTNAEFLYIGTNQGLEKDIVSKLDIPFSTIDIQGFRRKLSFKNINTIIKFFKSVRLSKKYLREFRPDVVIGTGGFVCGPVLFAANRLNIFTFIHEQNVVPGLTNMFLAKYVDLIGVSFSGSIKYFKETDKVKVTGNPCATEVINADKGKGYAFLNVSTDKKIILIFGGSRGAKAINTTFLEMITKLNDLKEYHFVFVTGKIHYDTIISAIGNIKSNNISLYPYLYNMPEILSISYLIISRAGASTLAEITALGIPAILIPSPYVTNNHQEKNAIWLEDKGAVIMIKEKELNKDLLISSINHIANNYNAFSVNAKSLGIVDSATIIYNEINNLLNSGKKEKC